MPPKGWKKGWKALAREGAHDGGPDRERSRSPARAASSSSKTWQGGMRSLALQAGSSASSGPSTPSVGVSGTVASSTDHASVKDFQDHIMQLFTQNKFSAPETVALLQKAAKAGTPGMGSFARLAGGGKHMKNAHRDVMRTLLRGASGPSLYWAQVPLWNDEDLVAVPLPLPFLLPHEIFAHYLKSVDLATVRDMSPELAKIVKDYCKQLKLEANTFVPLGLHADGVPHQKGKSIDVFHWNFLGQPGSQRILSTVVASAFVCQCGCQGRHTLDAVMSVLCWSFRAIIMGTYPTTRHDGTPFSSPQDKERSSLTGSLGGHGGLLQVRGDWSYYKRLFSFPGWQHKLICWKCQASREGDCPFTDFGGAAAWRTHRYKDGDFWKVYKHEVHQPSPLFQLPGFSLDFITIDILHAMDLGVIC